MGLLDVEIEKSVNWMFEYFTTEELKHRAAQLQKWHLVSAHVFLVSAIFKKTVILGFVIFNPQV